MEIRGGGQCIPNGGKSAELHPTHFKAQRDFFMECVVWISRYQFLGI